MRGFFIALTFLTRIPLPEPKRDITAEEFARSYIYYPLIGLIIGAVLWLLAKVLYIWFPPSIFAALLLIAELILTGGLHLDGFMDSMDGLLSARQPEEILEIMKDSRVGAHACMALTGLLLLKFSLLANLPPTHFSLLLAMPLLSRWVFQIGLLAFPYARPQGLGKDLQRSSNWLPFLLNGCWVLGLIFFLAGFAGLIAFGLCLIVISALAARISALLGGLTGDLYGAFIEISEIIFLLAVFPFI